MTQSLNSGQTLNNKKTDSKSQQKMDKFNPIYPRIADNKGPQVLPSYTYPKTPNSDSARPPEESSIGLKKPNFMANEDSNRKNGYPSQYRGAWNQYYQQNDGYNSGDNRGSNGGYATDSEYLNGYNRDNSNSGSYWPTIGRQQPYDVSDQMMSNGGQTYLGISNKPQTETGEGWPQINQNNYDSNYYDRISRIRANKPENVRNIVPNDSLDSKTFPKQMKSDSIVSTKSNLLNHKYEKQLKSQSKAKEDSNKLYDKPNVSYSHISSNRGSANSPVVAVSYMHDSSQQNGRETNSAVIALSLGLCVTALLIVLVGCRMKSFKRKIARRGRPLAHDADYLVNGMYL